jgi:hypothetical protein
MDGELVWSVRSLGSKRLPYIYAWTFRHKQYTHSPTLFSLFQTSQKTAILGENVLESVNPSIQVQNERPKELNAKVMWF